jgi:hypothetical protein
VAGALLLALAGACALLYAVPPATQPLCPPCPFHALTALHCPGCGTLRACHELLHGRPAAALGLNPLAVLALPFVAWALLGRAAAALLHTRLPSFRLSAAGAWALVAVVLAFGVLRNLPAWPFTWLAP